jgi:hypothetical protein
MLAAERVVEGWDEEISEGGMTALISDLRTALERRVRARLDEGSALPDQDQGGTDLERDPDAIAPREKVIARLRSEIDGGSLDGRTEAVYRTILKEMERDI